mmetsp:Transcript_44272/g.103532  ORF Transcript_44272/g.103532 Transcript_44272/m.103532 type:complete len:244 (-) Transcript_44272:1042-1773(-)
MGRHVSICRRWMYVRIEERASSSMWMSGSVTTADCTAALRRTSSLVRGSALFFLSISARRPSAPGSSVSMPLEGERSRSVERSREESGRAMPRHSAHAARVGCSACSSRATACASAAATAGSAASSVSECAVSRMDGACGCCTCARPECTSGCTAAPVVRRTDAAAERSKTSCRRCDRRLRADGAKRTCAMGDAARPRSSTCAVSASAAASASCSATAAVERRASRSGSACSTASASMAATVA